jgi:hypothetical protein
MTNGTISSAILRKTAIWPRVTGLSGQYRGGVAEHPPVMPRVAKYSIYPQNTGPTVVALTSSKTDSVQANCARLTGAKRSANPMTDRITIAALLILITVSPFCFA